MSTDTLERLREAGQRDPTYWYEDHCVQFLITHQLKNDGIAVLCRCYFRSQDHHCECVVSWIELFAANGDPLGLAYTEVIKRMECWVDKCSTSTPT